MRAGILWLTWVALALPVVQHRLSQPTPEVAPARDPQAPLIGQIVDENNLVDLNEGSGGRVHLYDLLATRPIGTPASVRALIEIAAALAWPEATPASTGTDPAAAVRTVTLRVTGAGGTTIQRITLPELRIECRAPWILEALVARGPATWPVLESVRQRGCPREQLVATAGMAELRREFPGLDPRPPPPTGPLPCVSQVSDISEGSLLGTLQAFRRASRRGGVARRGDRAWPDGSR